MKNWLYKRQISSGDRTISQLIQMAFGKT